MQLSPQEELRLELISMLMIQHAENIPRLIGIAAELERFVTGASPIREQTNAALDEAGVR